MSENIQEQILKELKEINKKLSVEKINPAPHPKPEFAVFIINEIRSLAKEMDLISKQIGAFNQYFSEKKY